MPHLACCILLDNKSVPPLSIASLLTSVSWACCSTAKRFGSRLWGMLFEVTNKDCIVQFHGF